MLPRPLDETLLVHLENPRERDQLLMELYNRHRERGADPALCALFLKRTEQFIESLTAQTATRRSLSVALAHLEADFGRVDAFDETLAVLRAGARVQITRLPAQRRH